MANSIYLAKVGTLQTARVDFVEDATSTSHTATVPIPAGSVIYDILVQNRAAWVETNIITTGGWTVGAGWTESPDETFTHANGGGTAALSHSAAAVIGRTYTLILPQVSGTSGPITVNFGGVLDIFPTADGNQGETTFEATVVAVSTAGLSIVPDTTYDGALANIEVVFGARLDVGDTADPNGYTADELQSGSAMRFDSVVANGAYTDGEGTVTGPTSSNFGFNYVAGSNIIATITNPVPSATAGRTTVVVYYTVPASIPIVSA